MSLKNLIKIANYYDVKYGFNSSNIYKISVPIDFIEDSPSYQKSRGKTNEAEFKDFFSKTKHKYRVIFTNSNPDINPSPMDTDVDTVKSNINKNINGFDKRIQQLEQAENNEYNNNYILQSLKNEYEEGKFLLGKIHEWLDKDSINILANFSPGDDVTPQALAHDICHNSIEEDIEKLIRSKKFRIPVEEIEKDYNIYKKYKNYEENSEELIKVSLSKYYTDPDTRNITNKIIESSIFFNDKRKNFISYKNFLDNLLFDMTADFLPLYFEQENTFNNVDIKGVEIKVSAYFEMPQANPEYSFVVKPKNENGDLPHIEKYIREILEGIRKIIEQKLDGLVGKVFSLW